MKYSLLTIFVFLFVVGFSSYSIYADEVVMEDNGNATTEIEAVNENDIDDSIDIDNQDIISDGENNDIELQETTTTIEQEINPILVVNTFNDGWNEDYSVYYRDGEAINGMQKIDDSYYLFNNQQLDHLFTGFVKSPIDNKWYFLRNGKSDWSFTGVAKSIENGRWYHAKKGKLDWSFTGFSKSVENGKWYFSKNGSLDWRFTGVAKSIENGKWYHANKGCLDWKFTGFSKSVENGRWYFNRNGSLDWKFTGVAKSIENGRYYFARNGQLNWSFNGVGKSITDGKWYYAKKGCLDWKYNGKAKDVDGNTYQVKLGRATIIIRKGHVYMTGIDISQWNGLIDLSKYIGQFVIIRATYGTTLDPLAIRHMNECERLGIPYGVYCYSYALNNDEAKQEANFLLNVIKGRKISLGVWYDMEDADGYKNRNNKLNGNLMSQFCNTFCNTVYSKGYYTGIYSSASWFTSYLSTTKKYPWWVAHWGVNDGKHNINTSNMGPMQQFTSVPLDRNVIYQPLSMFKR